MSLQWISIVLGFLAITGGMLGVFRPDLIKRFLELFPRSAVPAWIFTALCCWFAGREAQAMNMGAVAVIKPYIPVFGGVVFFACVIYMKELLAPRALGGFLLLIAVPILRTAAMSEAPMFQILSTVVYLWIIYGIMLLMSPWYFRKLSTPFIENAVLFKSAALAKITVGVLLLGLGIFVY